MESLNHLVYRDNSWLAPSGFANISCFVTEPKKIEKLWKIYINITKRETNVSFLEKEIESVPRTTSPAGQSSSFAQPQIGDLTNGISRRHPRGDVPSKNIWTAAAEGNLQTVEDLYRRYPRPNLNAVDPKFGSVLTAAAQSSEPALVAQLLTWNADPNIEGGKYFTALQAGAHSGNFEVVRMLLAAGAQQTGVGSFYGTAVTATAEKSSYEMVEALLAVNPAASKIKGGAHGSALAAAAFRVLPEMLTLLLNNGSEINDSYGRPL